MGDIDLEHLTSLTRKGLKKPQISLVINRLKTEILRCADPFIWNVLSEHLLGESLPKGIRSAWIFVIRPGICSPAHYHPNSVQFTTVIEGGGKIKIGEVETEVETRSPRGRQPIWYIIPKNASHGVITKDRAMVVFSFHTCISKELLEVETSGGRLRLYEK